MLTLVRRASAGGAGIGVESSGPNRFGMAGEERLGSRWSVALKLGRQGPEESRRDGTGVQGHGRRGKDRLTKVRNGRQGEAGHSVHGQCAVSIGLAALVRQVRSAKWFGQAWYDVAGEAWHSELGI